MNRLLLAATLAAAALAPAQVPRGVWGPAAGAQSADAEQAVTDRMRALRDAVRKNDAAAVGQIYSDDFTFAGPAGQVQTKAQRLESLKKYGAPASLDFVDLKVRVYGGAAVVTGRATWRDDDGSQVFNERATWVWVNQGGLWRLVASHFSPLDPAPSAAHPAEKKP